MPQRFDQSCHFAVGWVDLKEPLSVFKRARDISRITAETDDCQERITITRMPCQAILEYSYGIAATPA
jgi:hypothetical protein